MRTRKLCIIILLIISLVFLTGCGNTTTTEDLNEKVTAEINYLDSKIVSISNAINIIDMQNYKVETREIESSESESQGGQEGQSSLQSESSGGDSSSSSDSGDSSEQSDSSQSGSSSQGASKEEKVSIYEMKTTSILAKTNNDINWTNIKSEVELLYGTWDTIILDLYKINVPTDKVNEFSTLLNQVTANVRNEDIVASLTSLASLYGCLPGYLEFTDDSNEDVSIKNTKFHILNAYSLVEDDNWTGITSEINSAIENYVPVISNLEYVKGKEHIVNRIYIILNELKNSLGNQDKDIFYIHYKNLMNELSILT